ncbi:MAG: hypothetical protein J6Y07_02845 [Alphaproteobacteria bacterium]|nr:hypothetical protein [Alphaproteobacteria bacterium]
MRKFMVFGLFAAFIGFAFADDIADRQTVTSLTYVNDELSEKQDIFGAQSGTKVATFTNTAGEITPREVKSDLGNNTNDTALPTVGAVNAKLDATQNTLGENKHANYVATYTNAPGELGEKGIYQDNGTYANQTNTLVDAGTFNAALQNGLDNEFVCAGNDPATGNCWLWTIHDGGIGGNLINSSGPRVTSLAQTLTNLQQNSPVYCTANVYTGATVGGTLAFSSIQNTIAVPFTLGDTYKFSYSGNGSYTSRKKWCTTDNSGHVIEMSEYTSNIAPTLPADYIFIQWANNMSQEQLEATTIVKNPRPAGNTLLPPGYTPLEYIRVASDNRFIRLGLSGDIRFSFVAQSTRTAGETQVLFGSNDNVIKGTYFGESGSSGFWGLFINVGQRTSISPTTKISGDITFDSNGARGTVNGQYIAFDTEVIQGDWCLFGTCRGGGNFWGYVWEIKAYQSGVLVGNFIPARRGDIVGLYDTVSGTFKFPSTGSLMAGPEISNNVYLPQNQ